MKHIWLTFIAKLKRAHRSWTVRINGISIALIAMLPELQNQIQQLRPYLSDEKFQKAMIAIIVINIINILLRFKTNNSLADK